MRAGSLNQEVVFQSKTETQTGMGAVRETWADAFAFPIPAAFQVLGTREFPMHEKRHAETTARFVIRYRDGIVGQTEAYRIVHKDRTWNILGAEDMDGKSIAIHIEVSVVT